MGSPPSRVDEPFVAKLFRFCFPRVSGVTEELLFGILDSGRKPFIGTIHHLIRTMPSDMITIHCSIGTFQNCSYLYMNYIFVPQAFTCSQMNNEQCGILHSVRPLSWVGKVSRRASGSYS